MTRHHLKLFIWEGNGISAAYHDDGLLVVLAHNAAEARRIMHDERANLRQRDAEWLHKRDELFRARELTPGSPTVFEFWKTPEGRELSDAQPVADSVFWDGVDESIDRPPTRVVDVDGPKWIAFNGGGYD